MPTLSKGIVDSFLFSYLEEEEGKRRGSLEWTLATIARA